MPLRVCVLGSAAGGGFPQWNARGPGCDRARAGDPAALPRTQASLAVSGDDGRSWAVLDASPDLRWQIERTPALHPREAPRSSPIAAVVVTSADIDHIAGLLSLREGHRFELFATPAVHDVLAANDVFGVLAEGTVARRRIEPGTPFEAAGITFEPFIVPGKVPLYREGPDFDLRAFGLGDPGLRDRDGSTIGLCAGSDEGRRLFYVPGCAWLDGGLADRLREADLVFFDGTLWSDDEMVRLGIAPKTGRRMGHMSISGPDGVLSAFAPLGVRRKILIHLNNTNPVLLADSPERAAVAAAGWEVAEDGMEITL